MAGGGVWAAQFDVAGILCVHRDSVYPHYLWFHVVATVSGSGVCAPSLIHCGTSRLWCGS